MRHKGIRNLIYILGVVVALVGAAIVGQLFFAVRKDALFSVNVIEAVSIFLLGFSLIFLPNFRIFSLFVSFALGALFFLRIGYVCSPFRDNCFTALEIQFVESTIPIFIYVWISVFALFFTAIALFFTTVLSKSRSCLWIGGVFAGCVLAAELVVVGSYIADIPLRANWDLLVTLTVVDASAFILGMVGLLLYAAERLYVLKRTYFGVWVSVLTATVTLGIMMSSWVGIAARERGLALVRIGDEASIYQEAASEHIREFFFAIDRWVRRWEQYPEGVREELSTEDAQQYRAFYTYIQYMAIEKKDGTVELAEGKKLPVTAKPVEEQEFSLSIFGREFFGPVILSDGDVSLDVRIPVTSVEGEERFFHLVTNLPQMITFETPYAIKKNYAFRGYLDHKLFLSEGKEQQVFEKRYKDSSTWILSGVKIEFEMWPRDLLQPDLKPATRIYQLFLGFAVSFALGLCVFYVFRTGLQKRRAEALSLEKTFFVANISHELRTPLHGIMGTLSILETMEFSKEQAKWIAMLKESSQKLFMLISELIDISKIELSGVQLTLSNIDLEKVVHAVCQENCAKAKEKNLELTFDYPADLPKRFLLDETRLYQALTHLLDNAIAFTNEGRVSVEVKGELSSKGVYNLHLTVRDTGVGIEKSNQVKIFEQYKHIDVRSAKGSGLGLAIVKSFVESMGGRVDVQSEPEKGSAFTLQITAEKVESSDG
ncbi:MAG: hypothetical protein H7A36_01425 [Chlamydiales bacterium]|nr:hypothetical protein [Chlamydiales bacterium]